MNQFPRSPKTDLMEWVRLINWHYTAAVVINMVAVVGFTASIAALALAIGFLIG